jgi:hypothetical protein
MRSIVKSVLIAPALFAMAACKDKPADPSLNTDLGLAAQARTGAPLDSITAAERANAATAAAAPAAVAPAPAAAPRKTATTTRRTTTTRRSSSGGSSSSGSTASAPAPAPREEIHKNTKRDAAIGAGAGAILGGVVGKGGVKGAIIGGAAGAILGGVIGNNVDVQKKKVP